ncbi:MAG: non-ribosomal peptide synthetase, partial [Candidatus Eremiobacteraeota bacterium]|nr:non-ribosomal peptide synthetase [Candidatus Eremiobacteraeota bacterium]
EELRYGELEARATRLAHRLRSCGVRPGTRVGLYFEPSVTLVEAMLAVLKAGAAYVPLALEQPQRRLGDQIAAAGIALVVVAEALRERLPHGVAALAPGNVFASDDSSVDDPLPEAGPDDVAYVLFTSGSSGAPKGVAVTHGNLANYTLAISARLSVPSEEAWHFATVTSAAADLGYTAIFPALCGAGTLHVIPPEVARDAARFSALLAGQPVDVLKITPSHLQALLDGAAGGGDDAALLPRRWLVLGGEPCPWDLAERVRRSGACRVLNHYGPTETTVGACTFALDGAAGETIEKFGGTVPATVPIGKPLGNVRCYVLDARQQLVPSGVPGELYVAGAGVARGYVGGDKLTAARFSRDPFAGGPRARMYRTGDRVRRLPGGDLEFLGRLDTQIKVRGFRVELGEIESALATHPGVAHCTVTPNLAPSGQTRLCAYVVFRPPSVPLATPPEPHTPDAAALRTWLAERLPDHMLPDAFVALERLPLTPSGKVDRAALPPPATATVGGGAYVAPHGDTEIAVASVWAEVLGRERVGASDDFLQLGGHSIVAIRVLGRLSRRFGVRLTLRTLFETGTVAALAAAIDARRAKGPPPS